MAITRRSVDKSHIFWYYLFKLGSEATEMNPRPLYIDKIKPFIDAPFVKILSGVRRCGKSTLLMLVMDELKQRGVPEDQILHYRFDTLKHEAIKNDKLLYRSISEKINGNIKWYLFFDEIQEVKGWEKAVNALMNDFDTDIYVTGSNSRMLSSEISTYLTGRYITFPVYPLSFKEYLAFKETYGVLGDTYTEFNEYIKLGGFPAVHLRQYSQNEVYTIVKDIYNSTIFTDIVQRNNIRKVDRLERIVKFVFDNVGKTFSAKSISDYFKSEHRQIDIETIYNYLSQLEKAFIIYRCSRYDLQGKEILKTQEKFFLADPALKYSVLGYSPTSVASMLENLVYLELVRRGFDVYVGKFKAGEIDFVASRQNEKAYIQICREIGSEETERREYNRLLAIPDNYPKYVLMTDALRQGNYEGIQTMHIADFLLSQEI